MSLKSIRLLRIGTTLECYLRLVAGYSIKSNLAGVIAKNMLTKKHPSHE
ncbi:MAG: hypothetical protein ACFB16_07390 [Phormidesmis sp.]